MLWTIFLIGIKDTLNPLVFANVLIFLFILSTFCRGRREFFYCGILFLLTSLWTSYQSISGLFDYLLLQKEAYGYFIAIYSVIGVILLVLGCLNFVDWKNYKVHRDPQRFLMKWVVCFSEPSAARPLILKNPIRFFNLMGIFALLGFVVVLLSSIWPQGKQFYIAFYNLVSDGHMELGPIALAFYGLGNVLLFVLAWFFLGFLNPLLTKQNSKIDFISLSKIVASALFLANGIGLEYFVFQQL